MFSSLTDFQDQNTDFNRVDLNKSFNHNPKPYKKRKPSEIYFGKGNKVIDQYNKRRKEKENDAKFFNTKNKIKLVVYKNGFTLNDGPFRDSSNPRNYEFLEDVERGLIPQEFIRKGIEDLGILLINRKSELYRSTLYHSMPLSIDYININQNQTNKPNHVLDQFFLNQKNGYMNSTYNTLTPMRNERNNLLYNKIKVQRRNKKRKTVPENNFIKVIDLIEGKLERKKYIPFSGKGKLLANSFIEEYKESEVKSFIDNPSPSCLISIRLYNGETIKGQFNYNQTLSDIYYYAKKLSGLKQFTLLDGFPPKPLLDLNKTIEELNLENTVLTQKL